MGKYGKPLIVGFVVLVVVSFVLGMLGGMVGANLGVLPMLAGLFAGSFTAYIMANLAGNEKTRAADPETRAGALSLTPPAGQALLVVYREGFVGKAAGMNLSLDGTRFVQIKGGWFSILPVAPGDHVLSASLGGLAEAQSNAAEAGFHAASGQVHAFKAAISMGAMKNTIALTPVHETPDALRSTLQRLTLAETQPTV